MKAEEALKSTVFLAGSSILSLQQPEGFATCETFQGSLCSDRICIPSLVWYCMSDSGFSTVLSDLPQLSSFTTADLQCVILQFSSKRFVFFKSYFV